MTKPTDATAAADYAAVAAQYADIQKQAYATQDVKAKKITDFQDALDTYIKAHVTDPTEAAQMREEADKSLTSMATMADAQQNDGTKNNAGWDADRESLEGLLGEIAPEGAEPVYTPTAAAGGVSGGGANNGSAGVNAGGAGQSGAGWGSASLDDPQTSATYKGLSLDQMLADPNSLVAQEIGNQPDVVDAIRKKSAQYGIPDGLIAATIIQETNGDRTNLTGNSGYGDKPADQQFDAGVTQAPLWSFPGATTAEKNGVMKSLVRTENSVPMNGKVSEISRTSSDRLNQKISWIRAGTPRKNQT